MKKGASGEEPCFKSNWRAKEDEAGHWVQVVFLPEVASQAQQY